MKKILLLFSMMFCAVAHAKTVNIDWLMDDQTYAQTTCETGGNFALPTPTPTKYGYHFVGWQQNDAIGSWSQSGTPTPTNPIEPTFTTFGNTVLRAAGSGNNFVADSYDPTTGKITRRVGVQVLDGTENWDRGVNTLFVDILSNVVSGITTATSTHYIYSAEPAGSMPNGSFKIGTGGVPNRLTVRYVPTLPEVADFKQWLADQYAAGTPVTVYYQLATPVEENYNAQ